METIYDNDSVLLQKIRPEYFVAANAECGRLARAKFPGEKFTVAASEDTLTVRWTVYKPAWGYGG